jgi:hypothetical protein
MMTENEITALKNAGVSKDTKIQCNYCKCTKPITQYLMGFSTLIMKTPIKNMCDFCENKS